MDTPEIGPPGGVRNDRAHTARTEMVMWSDAPNEHGPAPGVRGTGVLQVFDQPATDIGRQRHPFTTIALAAHDDCARAPIDIVQRERCNLAAPQAEADQQGQNRQIAAADGCAGIACGKQAPHLIGDVYKRQQ